MGTCRDTTIQTIAGASYSLPEITHVTNVWTDTLSPEISLSLFFFNLERGERRKKEGEKHQCVRKTSIMPQLGTGPQPRHVLWPGIELATFCFIGWHSTNWATPARAAISFFTRMETNYTLDSAHDSLHHIYLGGNSQWVSKDLICFIAEESCVTWLFCSLMPLYKHWVIAQLAVKSV